MRKLDPRTLVKNPVIFVTAVVSALVTVLFVRDLVTGQPALFSGQIAAWLWFTVLFANFAEAIAEGRGRAQAEALRRAREETRAKRILMPGDNREIWEGVDASQLRPGDIVLVEAGDMIPGDGEVIEGIASVNEAAITGESAPVIREAGGDRSAVTGGTTVLSDWIVVRITAAQGSSFLDRMIALVEGAERQKTPNEIALNILLAGMTIIFLIAVVTLTGLGAYSGAQYCRGRAGRAVRDADPDDHRRPAVGHRHCRHGSAAQVQRARHVRARGRGGRRRRHAAARQDRHDHLRQPPGDRDHSGAGRVGARSGRSRAARKPCRRDRRRPLDRRPGAGEIRPEAAAPGRARNSSPFRPRPGFPASRSADAGCARAPIDARGQIRRARPRGSPVDQPAPFRAAVERIARSGGTPLGLAEGGRLLGVIHLKDVVKPEIKQRFVELRRMGIKTVMITGDNPVTAAAIASEAGVADFIAEATPEDKLRYIRDEQAQGRLIAMCGDGTNDAPALAQADVGVAMQSGTQAAREAGNMVDLDSDPTKLIEVVEIGKQLLMTRGALTTFSIANDVAKYFAIIPALFVAALPELGALNVMGLATPQSAILSAVIFNALIIVALIPLALRGVAYRPVGRRRCCAATFSSTASAASSCRSSASS